MTWMHVSLILYLVGATGTIMLTREDGLGDWESFCWSIFWPLLPFLSAAGMMLKYVEYEWGIYRRAKKAEEEDDD